MTTRDKREVRYDSEALFLKAEIFCVVEAHSSAK